MTALATNPAGRGKLIPHEIDGHRVGFFPGSSLIYAEGHPGEAGTLASPLVLEDRCRALHEAISDVGVPLPKLRARRGSPFLPGFEDREGDAGIRRLDPAVDVACEEGSGGMALLTGVASLDSGRLDRDVRYNGRSIGTVSWLGARGKLARVYDKGVESGSAPRGERIRLEAQYRWARESRREASELTPQYVGGKFVQRFAPLWRASNGIKVVSRMAMIDRLREAVRAGDLTLSQAEQVLAYQALTHDGPLGVPRNTDWRRRRLIADSGFILADAVDQEEEVEVDLAEVLDAVMGTEAWERGAAS